MPNYESMYANMTAHNLTATTTTTAPSAIFRVPVVGPVLDGLHRGLRSSFSDLAHDLLFALAVVTVSAATLVALLALAPVLLVAAAVFTPTLPILALLAYTCSTLVYLMSAQYGRPKGTWVLLRWHPVRVAKVFYAALQSVVLVPLDPVVQRAVVFSVNWIFGGRDFRRAIVTDLPFSQTAPDLKLDVYCTTLSQPMDPSTQINGNGIRKPITTDLAPVLVFIYGGAWSSGSKSYYRALGHTFARRGIVTVIPDYRTFPKGTMDDMISDVADALNWVHNHIHQYGGNPNNVHLMGHSAGAHLSLLTLLVGGLHDQQTLGLDAALTILKDSGYYSPSPASTVVGNNAETARGRKTSKRAERCTMPSLRQRIPQVQSCVLLSGVFNIVQHYDYEAMRGVEEISGMRRASRNSIENMLLRSPVVLMSAAICSPSTAAASSTSTWYQAFASTLPKRMCIVHGTDDHTVPCTQATMVAELVRSFNPHVHLELRDAMNHVQPVADLMTHDSTLFADVAGFILGGGPSLPHESGRSGGAGSAIRPSVGNGLGNRAAGFVVGY